MYELCIIDGDIMDDIEDRYDEEANMPKYCVGIMDTYNLEEEVMENALPEVIRETMKTLTPKEQLVIYLHYGFITAEPVTLKDIGCMLGIKTDHVSLIHRRALCKLRHPSKACSLRSWVSC